jgi:hypothetical protein
MNIYVIFIIAQNESNFVSSLLFYNIKYIKFIVTCCPKEKGDNPIMHQLMI